MTLRASRWGGLLTLALLGAGVGAGIWKQAGVSAAQFSVLFALGKTIACWGAWALKGRRPIIERGTGSFWAVSIFAALLNGAAWIAYFAALERGPLGLVQTVTSTYNAIGALLAIVFLREQMGKVQAVGIVLVLAAGLVMAAVSEGPWAAGHARGWLLPSLLTVGLWGANTALIKYGYSLPAADDCRMYLAHWSGLFLVLLPFGLFWPDAAPWHLGRILPTLAVIVLYIASDLALYAATARGPASIVSPLFSLYPGISIAYGAVLLGEFPSAAEWGAIALALLGTLLLAPAQEK